ncbi:MAG: caspase family protein [Rhodospirillales bacterium]|nr:caspase family protein [Rhodospirillales bacterium]
MKRANLCLPDHRLCHSAGDRRGGECLWRDTAAPACDPHRRKDGEHHGRDPHPLARERTLGEDGAGLLKDVAGKDPARLTQGRLLYGDARAEFAGLIEQMKAELAAGRDPAASPDFQRALQAAVGKRDAFITYLKSEVLPPEGNGKAGVLAGIAAAAELIPALAKGVAILWEDWRKASANGDTLIGWQVNRGRDQAADFFPAAQFRERFYRPDVIARVLDTLDVGAALRQADTARGAATKGGAVASLLPPVIEIVHPQDGIEAHEATLDLAYRVRSPAGKPITGVFATADGRPLTDARREVLMTSAAGEESGLMIVPLPKRDAKIALLAKTVDGQSEPATIVVHWRGPGFAPKPKLYVLAVGVRDYRSYQPLKYADRDASDFAARMQRQNGGLFADVKVLPLLNEHATNSEVEDGIDWIRREVTENDIGIVFMSGHGKTYLGDYYFLPYDVDDTKLFATGVSKDALRKTFNNTTGKVVVFPDTCHAGGVQMASTKDGTGPDINGLVNELAQAGRGVVVFASSTGNQLSVELDAPWRHGAFTQALLEALDGGRPGQSADYNHNGAISTDEINVYVRNRVKDLAHDQTPVSAKPDATPDFPLAIVR